MVSARAVSYTHLDVYKRQGEDGRRGAAKRGAFVGGVFGLLAGGLLTAVWSSAVGPEQASWGPVLSITLAATLAGMVVGAISNRKG